MRVRVLFFGVLRDSLSSGQELELASNATAGDVLRHYREFTPGAGSLWGGVAIAVNQQYVPAATALHEGDEVALLPPVSGGLNAERAWLTRDRIPLEQIVEEVKRGEDGAVVTFDGIVRNNTRGRQTLYLDYQGYEAMAVAQMLALVADALVRYPVRDAVLVHRLGRLGIGESSVLVVVASAHRSAAFEACRWLIDTLKTTVPIWKKEHFVDGAVWADGEPFPEEIVPAGERD